MEIYSDNLLVNVQKVLLSKGVRSSAFKKIFKKLQANKNFNSPQSTSALLALLIQKEGDVLIQKLKEYFLNTQNPIGSLNDFLNWRLENYDDFGRVIFRFGSDSFELDVHSQKKLKKIYGEYMGYLIQILNDAKSRRQIVDSTPVKDLAGFIMYGLEGGMMSVQVQENEKQLQSMVEMIKRVIRSYRVLDY